MNRHLLAGASALALLAGASAANAQFTFSFGGDAQVDFGYTSLSTSKTATGANTIANDRSTDFTQRSRITITATQKADSGLSYGTATRIRFGGTRANSATYNNAGTINDVDYDRAFIFVNGGFGQVVVGQNYGFYSNSFGAADAWGTGGSDGIWGNFVGGSARGAAGPGAPGTTIANGTLVATGLTAFKDLPVSADSNSRVYYVTPSFSGLTASVGFAPTTGSTGRAAQLDKDATTYNDVVELGAAYTGNFDAVRIELWAGYTFGEGRPGSGTGATFVSKTEDLAAYALAGRVTFGPARFSVHYTNAGKSGQANQTQAAGVTTLTAPAGGGTVTSATTFAAPTRNNFKDDATSLSFYGDYAVLPELTVGASYAVYTGPGSVSVAGEHQVTVWSLGAAYTVAPGLTLRPEYVNYKMDNKELNGRDYDGNIFVLRTLVAF